MILSQFISRIVESCSEHYDPREARSIANLLAYELCGMSRVDIALEPNKELESDIDIESIMSRLLSGEPVQYIIGRTEFNGLNFDVGIGVLIPRPETEELVVWISQTHQNDELLSILDIGTGSGIIAISLAKYFPNSKCWGVDIEDKALYWAERNRSLHSVDNLIVEKQDALQSVAKWNTSIPIGEIDIIVSNPPYIPQSDIQDIELHVKLYEPHSALFVPDNDELLFYRAIAIAAQSLLRSGGELYFEIYELFGSQMQIMLSELGYEEVEIKDDINSKPRMCRCVKR